MQLVIPMSGSGKRFRDAGYKDPKPLIRVDDVPMIQHVVSLFPGVTDVTFICNTDDLRDTDMRSILLGVCPSAKIVEIAPHKKGPVWAVAQAFGVIADDAEVIVSYCDYGTQWDFAAFQAAVKECDGAIVGYKGFHPHMLGSDNYAFCREQDGTLLEIREKAPFTSDKMSEFASNGTYYFKSGALVKRYFIELMSLDMNVNGEYYVSLVYNLLVRDGLAVKLFEIEKMLQWGTPNDLKIYNGWSDIFARQDFTTILPMAGKGERFKQEGYDIPKPFLPIDGIPMVVKAVRCLPEAKRTIFVALRSHFGRSVDIRNHFSNSEFYFLDKVTGGQAESCEFGIKRADIAPNSPILISACDNAAIYNQYAFLDMITHGDSDVIVWAFKDHPTGRMNPQMYSWLDVDADGRIRDVACKRFVEGREHAIIGTMYFRNAKYFLDGLKENRKRNLRTNGELYVDDVISRNIEAGLKVRVFAVDSYICWGTPNDYKTYLYWSDYFKK